MDEHEPGAGDGPDNRLARMGVVTAVSGGTAFALAVMLVAVLGERAEDNALAWTLLGVMAAGVLSSLAAFVAAIATRLRGERTVRGWIPLAVFPAIIAFLVLGEALWWE